MTSFIRTCFCWLTRTFLCWRGVMWQGQGTCTWDIRLDASFYQVSWDLTSCILSKTTFSNLERRIWGSFNNQTLAQNHAQNHSESMSSSSSQVVNRSRSHSISAWTERWCIKNAWCIRIWRRPTHRRQVDLCWLEYHKHHPNKVWGTTTRQCQNNYVKIFLKGGSLLEGFTVAVCWNETPIPLW